MKHLLRRSESDALLDGEALGADSGLEDVEAFLADVRLEYGALPAPAPRPTLAATLDGRRELRPASGPVPKPTVPEPGPRIHYRLRPLTALVVSGAVLFGGLATVGALPGPVQRATADVTSHLGIHLPGGATTPPASVPTGRRGHGAGSSSTAPGSGQHDPTGTVATTPPSPGASTATPVAPGVPAPATPTTPTVPLPPPTTTPPSAPLPPTLGTTPLFTTLPSLPGLVAPTDATGALHRHRVP